MPEETLIIGTGVSATAYLSAVPKQPGETRTMVGGSHLWQNLEPTHLMGQPPSLLTGHVLKDPTKSDNWNRGLTTPSAEGFLKTSDFNRMLDSAQAQHAPEIVEPGWVTEIRWTNPRWNVRYKGRDGLTKSKTFDRVVITSGPGAVRGVQDKNHLDGEPKIKPEKFRGHVVAGNDFLNPNWVNPLGAKPKQTAAVYGGSATAAWVAEQAMMRGMRVVLWFTRPGREKGREFDVDSRFADAFPAGDRNADVREKLKNVRRVGKLWALSYNRSNGGFVAVYIKDADDQLRLFVPDFFIYALGQTNRGGGILDTLEDAVKDGLTPQFDRNRAISNNNTILALGYPSVNPTLLVLGSAVHNMSNVPRGTPPSEMASYASINKTLPPASAPPEGIAMAFASIEAFADFIPACARPEGKMKTFTAPQQLTYDKRKGAGNPDAGTQTTHPTEFDWDINFNTCNRTQLAAYIAQTSDASEFAANLAVDLLIKFRARRAFPFGLRPEFVGELLARCVFLYNDIRRRNPDLNRAPWDDVNLHEVVAEEILEEAGFGV